MNSDWLRAINVSNFNFERIILICGKADIDIDNKILPKWILSSDSYVIKQLNKHYKIAVSIDSYFAIHLYYS